MEDVKVTQLVFFIIVLLGIIPVVFTILAAIKTKDAAETARKDHLIVITNDYETAVEVLCILSGIQVLNFVIALLTSIKLSNRRLFIVTLLTSLSCFFLSFGSLFVSFAGSKAFVFVGVLYSGLLLMFCFIAHQVVNRNSDDQSHILLQLR